MKMKIGSSLTVMAIALLLSACAGTSAPHPIVGDWALTIDTPVGVMNSNLSIDEELNGEMSSQDLGTAPLNNVTVEGENVGFSVDVNAQGQAMTLDFAGTVNGDEMQGNFNTDFGAVPVTGTRI